MAAQDEFLAQIRAMRDEAAEHLRLFESGEAVTDAESLRVLRELIELSDAYLALAASDE